MKLNLLRVLVTIGVFAIIGVGARVHLGTPPEHAVLRLSWSLVGEQITRTLSAEELEALPTHMRPPDGVAESTPVPYRLVLSIDGKQELDEVVRPAGLKGDRPMYVFHDIPLEPGTHSVSVSFEPEETIPDAITYELAEEIDFEVGRIRMVDLERGSPGMILK